jgi:hypothetical protein
MPAKSHDDNGNILQWLFERGEETLGHVVQDLVGGRGLPDGVSRVIDQAAKTKGRMVRNVEGLLHLLNLPSRADYHKLLVKVEHLQGSLVNLSMKLDRLLAAQDKTKKTEKRKTQTRKPDDI